MEEDELYQTNGAMLIGSETQVMIKNTGLLKRRNMHRTLALVGGAIVGMAILASFALLFSAL